MKVGDKLTRLLTGTIPHIVTVTELTDDRIICGHWKFDRATGAEIDDYFNFGPPPKMTGSYLKEVAEGDSPGAVD